MTTRGKDAEAEPTRTVMFTRPRCPWCGSTKLRARRTVPHDAWSDAVRRYSECRNCGRKIIVVAE